MSAILFICACSHNGVVHEPLASSSILVGPSFYCTDCYTVSNYGMNYIYHVSPNSTTRLPHNTAYFPIAAATLRSGLPFAVVDIGSSFRYSLNDTLIEPPEGCPNATVSKFYKENGSLAMFDLMTGDVYTLGALSCTLTASWSSTIDWESVWGGAYVNTESPVFYAYHRFGGCTYFFLGGPITRVVSNDCNFSTPPLNDGGGPGEVHSGGDLFVWKNRLALANGETGMKTLLSRANSDDHYAGKVIFVDDMSIQAVGLRHPWSAAALENGSVAIADVGQSHSEDLSILEAEGSNFGWPMIEGNLALQPWVPMSDKCTHFVLPSFYDQRRRPKADVLKYTWSMFAGLLAGFALEAYFLGPNFVLLAASLTLCPRIAIVPNTDGYVNFASIGTVSMADYHAWGLPAVVATTTIYTAALLLCFLPRWWAGIPVVAYMVGWCIALPPPWTPTAAAYIGIVVVAGATCLQKLARKRGQTPRPFENF